MKVRGLIRRYAALCLMPQSTSTRLYIIPACKCAVRAVFFEFMHIVYIDGVNTYIYPNVILLGVLLSVFLCFFLLYIFLSFFLV